MTAGIILHLDHNLAIDTNVSSCLTLIKILFFFFFNPLHDSHRPNSTQRKFLRNQTTTQDWSYNAHPYHIEIFQAGTTTYNCQQHGAALTHFIKPALIPSSTEKTKKIIKSPLITGLLLIIVIYREEFLKYSTNNYISCKKLGTFLFSNS